MTIKYLTKEGSDVTGLIETIINFVDTYSYSEDSEFSEGYFRALQKTKQLLLNQVRKVEI